MLPVAANPLPHKPQTSRSQMSAGLAMTGFRFELHSQGYVVCRKSRRMKRLSTASCALLSQIIIVRGKD